MLLNEISSFVRPEDGAHQPVTLSIIVPVYNEAEVLGLFHQTLEQVLATLPAENVEVIYINDGSTDDSWSIMNHLTSRYAALERVNLSRNFGKEAAMTAGLDLTRGQAVIPLDADLQDPPELIPIMLQTWRKGYDVVNMKRRSREKESWFKQWAARCYYRLLSSLSHVPIERDVGDFRLLSAKVVKEIRQLPERNRYMKGLMAWPGFRQASIEFDRPGRAAGETKWSFFQLIRLGLAGITSFSVKPLKLATWLGAGISAAAFVYSPWVIFKTLFYGEPVAGYPTMMLVQLWLGGVQLIAIGVLGEYVGCIFNETKQRPIYLIMEQVRSESFQRQKVSNS